LTIIARSNNEDTAVLRLHCLHELDHDHEIQIVDDVGLLSAPGHVDYASVDWYPGRSFCDLDQGFQVLLFNVVENGRKYDFGLPGDAASLSAGYGSYYRPVNYISLGKGIIRWAVNSLAIWQTPKTVLIFLPEERHG
jgi:hypothetical protein